jgi:hypothetical protein
VPIHKTTQCHNPEDWIQAKVIYFILNVCCFLYTPAVLYPVIMQVVLPYRKIAEFYSLLVAGSEKCR